MRQQHALTMAFFNAITYLQMGNRSDRGPLQSPASLMSAYKNQSLARRFGFAVAGLCAAWRSEHTLRYQLAAFVCVLIFLIAVGVNPLWWALGMLTSSLVITAELFNTALEHLVDHLHPETHPRIRIVKD